MKSCCSFLQLFTLKLTKTSSSSLLIIIFLLFTVTSFAQVETPLETQSTTSTEKQNDPKPETLWPNRFFTGGGLGLQFGSYTYVQLSPILGYRFTPKFSAGIGITYIYLRDKAYDYETSIYGGKVFAEYDVYKGISPHIEYELLNLEAFDAIRYENKRVYVNTLLIGASYQQRLGSNSSIYIMLLYNLLEDIYSPYENPILRIGFNIGL